MRYEAYENRIKKVAKALALILRHVFLFASLLILVVGATVAFCFFKGQMISAECPESFAYGDEIHADANAFCSRVSYEYAGEDGVWSDTVPTMPGNYRVRALSKRTFGSIEYSDEMSFSIVPRKIEVKPTESVLLYGEQPTPSADLAEGDVISAVEFDFGDYYEKLLAHSGKGVVSELASKLSAIAESVKITNAAGEDVTHAYSILDAETEIGILRRTLTVAVEDKSKEYDGIELAWDVYEITDGSLAEGDLMVATFNASLINVGTVPNIPTLQIKDGKGRDVNPCYLLEIIPAEISIEKRSLYITTASEEWIYDAKKHSNTDYEIASGSLLEGHELLMVNYPEVEVVNQGAVENILYFEVVEDGEQSSELKYVSNYYSIMLGTGTIKINPYEIITSIPDHELIYDGSAHPFTRVFYFNKSNATLSEPSWSERAEYGFACRDAQVYDTYGLPIIVLSGDSTLADISSNFKIMVETYGKITVHKRRIELVSEDYSKIYDDNRYDHPNWMASVKLTPNMSAQTASGLCYGHSLLVTPTVYEKNVGVYENSMAVSIYALQNDTPFVPDGMVLDAIEDVSHNYEIITSFGKFEILPRELMLKPVRNAKVYDGTPLVALDRVEYSGLLPQHIVTAKVEGSITNVEESGNVSLIIEDSVQIRDLWDIDVTGNYSLTLEAGELAVTPKPLTVYTMPLTVEYDGERHTNHEIDKLTFMQLLEGHELSYEFAESSFVESVPKGQTAGRAANALDKTKTRVTRTADGEDMTPNYAISYKFGLLTLNPRPLTIKTPSREWMYDGEEHYLAEFEHIDGELLEGHAFADPAEINMKPAMLTLAGETENRFSDLVILDGELKNVASNYKVTQMCGTLTVTPRTVVLLTDSATKVFDNTYLEAPGATASENSPNPLVEGDTVKLKNSTRIRYVTDGIVTNQPADTLDGVIITNEKGQDVTSSYAVLGYDLGVLEITKCPIKVITPSYTRYFDGSVLSKTRCEVVGAPEGFYAQIFGYTGIREPGSIENTCKPEATRVLLDTFDEEEYWLNWGELDTDMPEVEPIADEPDIYEPDIYEPLPPISMDIDLTENFEIVEYEYGTLTVLEGTIIYVRISPTVRMYTGGELGIDFEYVTDGYEDKFDIDFSAIDLTRDKVSGIMLEDLLAEEYKAVVTPKDPNNTNKYGVRFYMEDPNIPVLRITKRSIAITAASATFNYVEGQTFTHNVCNMTVGSLAPGHRLVATCSGSIYCDESTKDGTSVRNSIASYKIYDKDGKDVTKYYVVSTYSGTLTVVNVPPVE
ncbi:MAG: hypothetical protein IJW52_03420 [Clostridia bacterium]|nr:hypothetical protein [Clostridia bacterium]